MLDGSVLSTLHRGREGRNLTLVTRAPGFETRSGSQRIISLGVIYRKDLL